jgi:hypothetical protein
MTTISASTQFTWDSTKMELILKTDKEMPSTQFFLKATTVGDLQFSFPMTVSVTATSTVACTTQDFAVDYSKLTSAFGSEIIPLNLTMNTTTVWT